MHSLALLVHSFVTAGGAPPRNAFLRLARRHSGKGRDVDVRRFASKPGESNAWKVRVRPRRKGHRCAKLDASLTVRKRNADMPPRRPNYSTKAWGALLWTFIHLTALKADRNKESRARWRRAMRSLSAALPCAACRRHFRRALRTFSFSGKSSFACSVALHNAVNVRNGRPKMSEASARRRYVGMERRGTCVSYSSRK